MKSFNRRSFLKISVSTAGGLLVATHLPGCGGSRHVNTQSTGLTANAFLHFSKTGDITFTLPRVEMGQGTYTGLTTVIAEELEVDPERITVVFAPAAKVYNNPDYHNQMTGGSTSLKAHFIPLSQTGADTRQLFINAAARQWDVAPDQCAADNAVVTHTPSGNTLAYSALIDTAASLEVPTDTPLKQAGAYKYIGKPRQRLDTLAKTFGYAQFGIDVRVDNMLVAVVARPPVVGGSLLGFDDSNSKNMPGIHAILAIPAGLAVVAESYWQARQALAKVSIEWDDGDMAGLSKDSLFAQYRQAADNEAGDKVRTSGSVDKAFESGATIIEAEYSVPFLAHATLETQNCVADVQQDRCDVWAPTQAPDLAMVMAADVTGLSFDQIHIHTTFLGGGFGRRLLHDFVAEAVSISKALNQPVQVIWSREDDITHDSYRPATYNRMKAGIDERGQLVAWQHQIVGPSVMRQFVPKMIPAHMPEAVPDLVVSSLSKIAGSTIGTLFNDNSSTEGADDFTYAIANIDVRYVYSDAGVPLLWWRSVGHSQNAFMVEGFIDEAAYAAGKDPYVFRAALLAEDPRRLAVLKKAAQMSGWGQPLPENHYHGIAVHKSFDTYVAEVAEVELVNGQIRVHRVSCAVDCGLVVNPDVVITQMESGIIFGLTAALYGEISHRDGRVQQSNFHNYPMLRMSESPAIDVHIIDSDEPPTGVGEPAVPPILPAVANAVFAASGQRLREAPLKLA